MKINAGKIQEGNPRYYIGTEYVPFRGAIIQQPIDATLKGFDALLGFPNAVVRGIIIYFVHETWTGHFDDAWQGAVFFEN